MLRKGDKLFPVSWEEAAQAAAQLIESNFTPRTAPMPIGFIGSNRTSNEENYLLQRLARDTLWHQQLDHHRTADYTGLITALGESAEDSSLTMEQLYNRKPSC